MKFGRILLFALVTGFAMVRCTFNRAMVRQIQNGVQIES
jgi:hypothetical protein